MDGDRLVLDGGEGEGGGQILRTALSLSLITGRPFRIDNVRAQRKPPGLRPQHLACVRGALAVSASQARGDEVGSSTLELDPGAVRSGDYELEVGTAGSSPLLLQCLYYPLALAGGAELLLRGGTHVPSSPSFHYLARVWLPAIRAWGFGGRLALSYAGFYPEGAGEWTASIPAAVSGPNRVDVPSRGKLEDVEVISMVAGLPFDIAERQAKAAVAALRERGVVANAQCVPLPTTRSRGSAVLVCAHFENTFAGFSALGEKGLAAEQVGRNVAKQLGHFMEGPGSIDEHLADQLLLPAALLAAGRLGAAAPASTHYRAQVRTEHLATNARVIERFLPVKIELSSADDVWVKPA